MTVFIPQVSVHGHSRETLVSAMGDGCMMNDDVGKRCEKRAGTVP